MVVRRISNNELYHHGVKGQKWGVRRYQNPDGTLTPAGRKRYGVNEGFHTLDTTSLSRYEAKIEKKNDRAWTTALATSYGGSIVAIGLGSALGMPLAIAAPIITAGSVATAAVINKINNKKLKEAVENTTPQQKKLWDQFNEEFKQYKLNATAAQLSKQRGNMEDYEYYTKEAEKHGKHAKVVNSVSQMISSSKKLTDTINKEPDGILKNATLDMTNKRIIKDPVMKTVKKEPKTPNYHVDKIVKIIRENNRQATQNPNGTLNVTKDYENLVNYSNKLMKENPEEFKKLQKMMKQALWKALPYAREDLKSRGML